MTLCSIVLRYDAKVPPLLPNGISGCDSKQRQVITVKEDIERLLYEAQRSRFTERRTEPRHPFARPVSIYVNDQPAVTAFAKDISSLGLGIISPVEFATGSHAVLRIHSVTGAPVHVRSEVRWSDKYGKGWFLVGWKFLSSAAPPSQVYREK